MPPPPFATLVLVQTAGGAYTWDVTFSLAITPSLDREKNPCSTLTPDCEYGEHGASVETYA